MHFWFLIGNHQNKYSDQSCIFENWSFVYMKMIINFEEVLFAIFLDYHGPLIKLIIKLCKNVFPTFWVKYFIQNKTLKFGL